MFEFSNPDHLTSIEICYLFHDLHSLFSFSLGHEPSEDSTTSFTIEHAKSDMVMHDYQHSVTTKPKSPKFWIYHRAGLWSLWLSSNINMIQHCPNLNKIQHCPKLLLKQDPNLSILEQVKLDLQDSGMIAGRKTTRPSWEKRSQLKIRQSWSHLRICVGKSRYALRLIISSENSE